MLADIHGNAVALRAVLDDASRYGVERWWALGDLVVFGPRPAEVFELLIGLPSIEFVMGNTDRHVVEGTAAFSMAGAGRWAWHGPRACCPKRGCSTGCRAYPPRRPLSSLVGPGCWG